MREEIEKGMPAGLVYEIRPGALAEATSEEIVEELRRTTVVVALVDHMKKRRRIEGYLPLPKVALPKTLRVPLNPVA